MPFLRGAYHAGTDSGRNIKSSTAYLENRIFVGDRQDECWRPELPVVKKEGAWRAAEAQFDVELQREVVNMGGVSCYSDLSQTALFFCGEVTLACGECISTFLPDYLIPTDDWVFEIKGRDSERKAKFSVIGKKTSSKRTPGMLAMQCSSTCVDCSRASFQLGGLCVLLKEQNAVKVSHGCEGYEIQYLAVPRVNMILVRVQSVVSPPVWEKKYFRFAQLQDNYPIVAPEGRLLIPVKGGFVEVLPDLSISFLPLEEGCGEFFCLGWSVSPDIYRLQCNDLESRIPFSSLPSEVPLSRASPSSLGRAPLKFMSVDEQRNAAEREVIGALKILKSSAQDGKCFNLLLRRRIDAFSYEHFWEEAAEEVYLEGRPLQGGEKTFKKGSYDEILSSVQRLVACSERQGKGEEGNIDAAGGNLEKLAEEVRLYLDHEDDPLVAQILGSADDISPLTSQLIDVKKSLERNPFGRLSPPQSRWERAGRQWFPMRPGLGLREAKGGKEAMSRVRTELELLKEEGMEKDLGLLRKATLDPVEHARFLHYIAARTELGKKKKKKFNLRFSLEVLNNMRLTMSRNELERLKQTMIKKEKHKESLSAFASRGNTYLLGNSKKTFFGNFSELDPTVDPELAENLRVFGAPKEEAETWRL